MDGARYSAYETRAAEGMNSVFGGEGETLCGSSVDEESAGEAEGGSGMLVLNKIEPEVMLSADGKINTCDISVNEY